MIDDCGYWVSVYTYSDGEIHIAMDCEPYGLHGRYYEYCPRTGIIASPGYEGAGEMTFVEYYKLTDNHSINYEYSVEHWYINDLNGNGYYDEGEPEEESIWYQNQQISEAEYQALPYYGYSFEMLSGVWSASEAIEVLQNM